MLFGTNALYLAATALASFVCWRAYCRYLTVVGGEYTYVIVGREGFKRLLVQSEFLWNPFEWVFRGQNAPDLSFVTVNEFTGEGIRRPLFDRKSGKVDLLVHVYQRRFKAVSRDQRSLNVESKVTFRLDQNLLKSTLDLGDFGSILGDEIEAAIYTRLSQIDDNEIGKKIEELQVEIQQELSKIPEALEVPRSEDRSSSKLLNAEILPLGVRFIRVKIKVTVEKPGAQNLALNDSIATNQSTPSRTAMTFDPGELDAIQNAFLGQHSRQGEPLERANRAILQILEMHTRQHIAASLVGSGNLVILSGGEFGTSANMVLREHLRELPRSTPSDGMLGATGRPGSQDERTSG